MVRDSQIAASPDAKPAKPGVLVIGPTPPPFHGVAMAMQCLLTGAYDQRLPVTHLDIADRRGIQHVDKPDLFDVYLFCRQWLQLGWLIIRRRPRIVYLAVSQSTIGFTRDALFVVLARLLGRRVVLHLHGGNFAQWYSARGAWLRWLVRLILGCCTRFIVLADTFRSSILPLVPAEKVVVVPNGIRWQPLGRNMRTGPAYRLLFLSTLSRAKGALLLLEALAMVRQQHPGIHLVMAGPWLHEADRRAAMERIATHGLESTVSFPGPVDGPTKLELYAAADAFVFPGIQQEGQPLVVLEAMAAGLPVVYSDRGCLAETLNGDECGVPFRLGNADDLASQLLWLLARPEEMRRLGRNGRRRYEAHYSERQFINNMTRVFMDAAGVTT